MLSRIPIHPFALTLFPLFSLLAHNLSEIPASQALRPILGAMIACGLMLILLHSLVHSWQKAAVLASMVVLLFFSYGHLYMSLKSHALASVVVGRHRHLIPATAIIACAIALPVLRTRRNLGGATAWLNLVALTAVLMPLAGIGSRAFVLARQGRAAGSPEITNAHLPNTQGPHPDIYYIILDGYARSDYMRSEFGYDNRPFLDGLREMGFQVAEQSHSNYSLTALSLGSSLNLQYVQDMGLLRFPGTYPALLIEPIHHSQVRRLLEEVGYRTVAFRSGYTPTEILDADLYVDALTQDLTSAPGLQLNGFEQLLLRTTVGLAFLDLAGHQSGDWVPFAARMPLDDQAAIALAQFQGLSSIAAEPGPKFVFAHILLPHYPYLFGPDGQRLSSPPDSERDAYRDQAMFASRMALAAIQEIAATSSTQPIIILQSDHGADREWGGVDQRFSILNAYLLPDDCTTAPYPTITPVNSFRVVLNCAFGGSFNRLEDISYRSLSPGGRNFEFERLEPVD